MSVFLDKKFEELDWISQATEPIDSKLNELLLLLPDEVNLDYATFVRHMGEPYYSKSIDYKNIIRKILLDKGHEVSRHDLVSLSDAFQWEIPEEGIIVNFEDGTLGEGIRLVKTKFTMDEQLLKASLGANGLDLIRVMEVHPTCFSRLNEVFEILPPNDGLKTKSSFRKRQILYRTLSKLFSENTWNIKDTELANKIGTWIFHYVQNEDLAAFSNLCRLKVMTHSGQPIYSMKEII